jgi:hypothetical protein
MAGLAPSACSPSAISKPGEGDAGRVRDPDAREFDSGAGPAGGDAGVREPGAGADDDAGADEGDAAVGDAAGRVAAPRPRWPDPALFDVSVEELQAADCRIDDDRDGDGSIEKRWGYEYDADGNPAREIVWESSSTDTEGSFEVTVYHEGKHWARCGARYCLLYQYDDPEADLRIEFFEGRVDLGVDAPQLAAEIQITYDEEGRLASWTRYGFNRYGELSEESHYHFREGTISSHSYDDHEQWDYSVTYHSNGTVFSYSSDDDPGSSSHTCDDDGFETYERVCEDDSWPCWSWSTTYSRNADGVIEQAQTTVSGENSDDEPLTASFSTERVGGITDGLATFLSRDDLGAWETTYELDLSASDEPGGVQILERDASGNALRVRESVPSWYRRPTDEHVYSYSGSGSCRQGDNPHLASSGPEQEPVVPTGCGCSPVTDEILDQYDLWYSISTHRSYACQRHML